MEAPGRPLMGTILGALTGIFVAVIIQQAGVWPLDRMLFFGAMALMAIVGFVLTKGNRGEAAARTVALVIILLMLGMAALGATEVGESGYIEGGCTASAVSDIDEVSSPAATSKSNPFDVDPFGSLAWDATSPAPILNHTWEIWVDVAGFPYLAVDGGSENEGESQHEVGFEQLAPYAEDIEAILGTANIGGIYEVYGWIEGEGGSCEGLGFVRIPNGWGQGPIALGAIIVVIILLVIIVMIGQKVRAGGVAEATTAGSQAGEDAPRIDDRAPEAPAADDEGRTPDDPS